MLPRRVLANSGWSLAGSALPILVLLVTVPLYLEQVGAARYGALAISWLLIGYFGQADFGIGRAVTRRLAALSGSHAAQRAGIVSSGLIVTAVIGVLGAASVYVLGGWFFAVPFEVETRLQTELLASLAIIAIGAPVVGIIGLASGSLMGLDRFRPVAMGNMVGSSLTQVLPLLAVFFVSSHLAVLIAASLVARLVHLAVLLPAVRSSVFSGQRFLPSSAEARGLLKFGKWVMVSALVGPLMIVLDRFAIGGVLGAVAVAAYTIPFQIASRTMILPSAFMQALFPQFSADQGNSDASRPALYVTATASLFAPVAIALICLAEPLLALWLGAELDARSVAVAQIVMAGFWINAVGAVPFTLLQARGEARFTAMLHLAELPFYLAALLLLGQAYGLAGMAAAFALRCAADCVILLVRSHVLGRRGALAVAAAGVPVAAALLWAPTGWSEALLAGSVLMAAALAIAWLVLRGSIRRALA